MSDTQAAGAPAHEPVKINEAWLNQVQEEAIEPDLPIVDVHHHAWDHSGRYMLDELLADMKGHNVRSSVFVQCWSMYRADGPVELRPVGETEFANGIAAQSASGMYGPSRLLAGIIGYCDLTLGARSVAALEAHVAVGGGRFKGVRANSAWDADPAVAPNPARSVKGLLADPNFRAGYAHFSRLGLLFEPSIFHHQIPEVADLARAFPDTQIVLNHVGGPLCKGSYANRIEEVYALWRANMKELATCPNVSVKLGGLGRRTPGVTFPKMAMPPTSEALAAHWKRYIEGTIAEFGVDRCMFESNFPVDKTCYSYRVVYNAFKRITAGYSASEKTALYSDTAYRVYGLAKV